MRSFFARDVSVANADEPKLGEDQETKKFACVRLRKITRSSRANCTIHNAANTPMFAAGSAIARPAAGTAAVIVPTYETNRVDTTNPASDRIQNGTTSRARSPRPERRHTQCRFPKYDAGIPQPFAIRLAVPAGMPKPTASITSATALSTVVPTETHRQRKTRSIVVRRNRNKIHEDGASFESRAARSAWTASVMIRG
jgi:hypothetical protein